MKTYILSNGWTVTVEKANRGFEDDYLIRYYEDGRCLDCEYGNGDYVAYMFDDAE